MSGVAIPKAEQAVCPICDRVVREKRMRKLYDVPVCRKCSNGFANRRQLGWIIDHVATIALSAVIGFLVGMVFPQAFSPARTTSTVEDVFWIAFSWVLVPMFFALKDGFSGYSPGKWLCGVRAVDWDTREPISFLQSFKRNLVLIIPVVPLLVAMQLIKGRRSGDKWANTCVVWEKKAYRMPFDPRGILCTKCGYNLTGNVSGRCPECGQEIRLKAPAARTAPVGSAAIPASGFELGPHRR
ncbi:MAG TPA: RDD family protein [Phycisphaerae bacterium]|nr:RDD family protein [Phycisphaerae bacterium]